MSHQGFFSSNNVLSDSACFCPITVTQLNIYCSRIPPGGRKKKKKHAEICSLTLFLEMHPLYCPPFWSSDKSGWRGKEKELFSCSLVEGREEKESQTILKLQKSSTHFFSVDESKILCSNLSPCVGCTWMRLCRGHSACDTVHLSICLSVRCLWGLRKGLVVHVSFRGVLFVCKWRALELGICIGTQDCLCQCDMLKHTLFFQYWHIRAVWRDTYRGSTLYRQHLSRSTLRLS